MKAIIGILLLATPCYGYTIKATGYVKATIVAPIPVELPGQEVNLKQETKQYETVVYTKDGATVQIVF